MSPLDWIAVAGAVALAAHVAVALTVKSRWDREAMYFVTVPVLLVAISCVAVTQGVVYVGSKTCENKADAMEREWRYDFWSECLVRTDDGQMVPLDQLRINETGQEVTR